jgi:hypothetical protein
MLEIRTVVVALIIEKRFPLADDTELSRRKHMYKQDRRYLRDGTSSSTDSPYPHEDRTSVESVPSSSILRSEDDPIERLRQRLYVITAIDQNLCEYNVRQSR